MADMATLKTNTNKTVDQKWYEGAGLAPSSC
jgi:hypothetical protein